MIFSYLKRYPFSVVFGNLFALGLAVVASLLGAVVGPAIQVMASDDPTLQLQIVDLLGERLQSLGTWMFGRDSLTRQQFLGMLPGFLLTIAAAKGFFTLMQWFTWERVSEKVGRDLRNDLVCKYLQLDPEKKLTDHQIDEHLSSLLSTDVRYLREYIVRFYGGLPREGFQTVFLTVTLILLSPKLFFVFAVGVAPVLALMNRLGKRLKRRANRALSDFSDLTEWLQQRLIGIETIKHYQTEAQELAAMKTLNDGIYRKFFAAAKVKALTSPLIEIMAVAAIGVVFWMSFRLIDAGDLTGSILISFFATLGLLSQSASKLGKYFNKNRETAAAIDRIGVMIETLDAHARKEVHLIERVGTGDVHISCQSINYQYPGQRSFALQDFTFEFEAGRIYGLVGQSGSGKSTLLNVILGLVRPQIGKVVISGGNVGYLPQSFAVFGGSVGENVAYPATSVNPERVRRLVAQFKLDDRIRDTDEQMHDGAMVLSGGQTQRLHIARLAYHRYPIILFDEGTSALDPETEAVVFRYLREVAESGGLVVMIAHRPSAIRYADQVLVMQQGQLAKTYSVDANRPAEVDQ